MKGVIKQGAILRNFNDFIQTNDCCEETKCLLRNWFQIKNSEGQGEKLLEPISLRKLNEIEIDFLKITGQAASSSRFSKNYVVFHSRQYKKNNSDKTNSYTVKFDKNGEHGFGFVEYFLKKNNKFYAVLTELLLCEKNIFFDLKGNFTAAIKSFNKKKYFDETFFIVYNSKKQVLISTTQIISKCFVVNLLNLENFYYVSRFITETEHD